MVDRMPGRYKVSAFGARKWLYRRAVRPLIPPALRPDLLGSTARLGGKLGFSTPMDRWFGTWLRQDAERYLLGAGARVADVLDGDRLKHLIHSARDRRLPRPRQLMSLYVLETWLRAMDGSRGAAAAPAAASVG